MSTHLQPTPAPAPLRARLRREERGMTLFEVLMATLILAIASSGLLSAFDAGRRSISYSELHSVATQVGERELQRVSSLKWEQIALNKELSWASGSSSTTDPTHYLSAVECDASVALPSHKPCYEYDWSSKYEPLVLASEAELSSEPDKATDPVTFTTSAPGGATRLSGSVYRYITWVNDEGKCEGTGNTCFSTSTQTNYKRVTVAVTMSGLQRPVVLSTLLINHKGEASNPLFAGAKCVEEGKPITEAASVECA